MFCADNDAHSPPPTHQQVPVLIVTSKAGKVADSLYDKRQLRLLLMVEGWAMHLLHFATDRLIDTKR